MLMFAASFGVDANAASVVPILKLLVSVPMLMLLLLLSMLLLLLLLMWCRCGMTSP
jgi:hypothetical protein